MTQPLTPPSFGSMGYNVGTTDIGSGYAAGISSAGQSIAGAIGAVMGGINQRTGEAQEGILSQKKSSEQTLDMLHTHGMIDDATYEKAMTSNLGAQQKMIGISTAEFNTRLQARLDQEKAMAVAGLGEQGAMSRQRLSSGTTVQTTQMQIDAEKARQAAELAKKGHVTTAPAGPAPAGPAPVPSFIPKFDIQQTDQGQPSLFRR